MTLEKALHQMCVAALAGTEVRLMSVARELTLGQVADARDVLSQVLDALAIADARDA